MQLSFGLKGGLVSPHNRKKIVQKRLLHLPSQMYRERQIQYMLVEER